MAVLSGSINCNKEVWAPPIEPVFFFPSAANYVTAVRLANHFCMRYFYSWVVAVKPVPAPHVTATRP